MVVVWHLRNRCAFLLLSYRVCNIWGVAAYCQIRTHAAAVRPPPFIRTYGGVRDFEGKKKRGKAQGEKHEYYSMTAILLCFVYNVRLEFLFTVLFIWRWQLLRPTFPKRNKFAVMLHAVYGPMCRRRSVLVSWRGEGMRTGRLLGVDCGSMMMAMACGMAPQRHKRTSDWYWWAWDFQISAVLLNTRMQPPSSFRE